MSLFLTVQFTLNQIQDNHVQLQFYFEVATYILQVYFELHKCFDIPSSRSSFKMRPIRSDGSVDLNSTICQVASGLTPKAEP